MLKKMLFSISVSLLGSFPLAADSVPVPLIVDYSKFPSIAGNGYYANFDAKLWQMGAYAFNYAPEVTTFFSAMKNKYNIDAVVETGTLYGGTTVAFASIFDEVHTIEIVPTNHGIAKNLLSNYPNVQCHLGNSVDVLQELLPKLKGKRVLFYLDAHWKEYWPLLDEFVEIGKTHKDQCIIVIDDFKVPGRPDIPYDYYPPHECSAEYILNHVGLAFSSASPHFIIPKSVQSRAKFVLIPTAWNE